MNLSDELQKLHALHQAGAIDDAEFAAAKARLLGQGPQPMPPVMPYAAYDPEYIARQSRQWAMFLHLSRLAGVLLPFAGIVLPIVLWQVKKNELPGIDAHGKVVMNWLISEIIYAVACIPLCFVFIGFPLLFAVAIIGIVFPIIGAVKADSGILWPYPMSIPFFK